MFGHLLLATLHLQTSLIAWARRVGGPGLIVLGLVDDSAIPVPGSEDAMTIILAAAEKTWWPYYAAMATAGALLGGYVTYRLARGEGKAILEKRISRRKAQKVYSTFEKRGFGAVVILCCRRGVVGVPVCTDQQLDRPLPMPSIFCLSIGQAGCTNESATTLPSGPCSITTLPPGPPKQQSETKRRRPMLNCMGRFGGLIQLD